MSVKRTNEEFIKELHELVGNNYTPLTTYKTTKTKVKIRHNLCMDSYDVEPRDFFKGRRCPKCAGNKRKTNEEFKNQIASIVNDEYEVLGEYKSNKIEIKMRHLKCENEFDIKPNRFLNGQRCPHCKTKNETKTYRNKARTISRKRYKKGNQLPPFEKSLGFLFPELVEEWSSKNQLDAYEVYSQACKKAWWRCKVCSHQWETRISTRTSKQKSGCPVCNESKGEKRIRSFLEQNRIEFISQKEFDNLFGTGGGNLSYDFFLPKENILIEYQGMQHHKFVEFIHFTESNFIKQLEHDRRKKEYAKLHNISLLEVWYWDFDKIEEILNKVSQ